MDEYLKKYLAERLCVGKDEIAAYKFIASESYTYSEYTSEDFSCEAIVTLASGKTRRVWMSEYDVVAFFNSYPGQV